MSGTDGAGGARTIVVADDSPDQQLILRTILEHAGYRVLIAEDGATAVQMALHPGVEMVIMDAAMPSMDGWAATAAIKASVPGRCVVMLSAHALPEHRRMAEAAGADQYLVKPLSPRDVLRVVRDCIG